MKKIRIKGKSIEEAAANGLKILGLEEGNARVVTISEGKAGVLGMFGGEEAEVEIRQVISKAEDAKEVLQEIINKLGLMAVADIESESNDAIMLEVKGEDLGMIIGKDGAMLRALQIIVSSIVGRDFSERVRVYVDAGGYRNKQEMAIGRIAEDAAKDVIESGVAKVLPPMSAADRRIIHMALKDNKKVVTVSRGEGPNRRLVICPNTDNVSG